MRFSKITSIKSVGSNVYYDLESPNYHNYYANGIVNHNSGKDWLLVRGFAYAVYKLECHQDPQGMLGKDRATPIDLVNICVSEGKAKDIFFDSLKRVIQSTINPKTGRNWFTERSMDIREGYDIQSNKIFFPKGITAYSLNSKISVPEGLSILLAALDEVPAFDPKIAEELRNVCNDNMTSRFPGQGKLFLLGYKRSDSDYMNIRYEESADEEDVFRSKASTWEVNPLRKKTDFDSAYIKNPDRARRVYENLGTEEVGSYLNKQLIRRCIQKNRVFPVLNDNEYSSIRDLRLDDSLQGELNVDYFIHFDLGKSGVQKSGRPNDCSGIALGHCEQKAVHLSEEQKKELALQQNIDISKVEGEIQNGVYADLLLQVKADKDSEIILKDLVDWCISELMTKRNFNIKKMTFDGWMSVQSIQQAQAHGIESHVLSVDRTLICYENLKELINLNLLNMYEYSIIVRELQELIKSDNKVDHPKFSNLRRITENNRYGSKDVADALAGMAFEVIRNSAPVSNSVIECTVV